MPRSCGKTGGLETPGGARTLSTMPARVCGNGGPSILLGTSRDLSEPQTEDRGSFVPTTSERGWGPFGPKRTGEESRFCWPPLLRRRSVRMDLTHLHTYTREGGARPHTTTNRRAPHPKNRTAQRTEPGCTQPPVRHNGTRAQRRAGRVQPAHRRRVRRGRRARQGLSPGVCRAGMRWRHSHQRRNASRPPSRADADQRQRNNVVQACGTVGHAAP